MTEIYIESLQDLLPFNGSDKLPNVSVHGRFVRKRHLSKGLVFGDIQLKSGELLEVMMRAQDGILDFAAIRRMNWDVHLGDLVTARGTLQSKRSKREHSIGWLFELHSIQVDELWSLHHEHITFSYTDTVSTKDVLPVTNVKGSWVLPPTSKAAAIDKYTNMVRLDGFNACKYYFSSSNGDNCRRGDQCHFWHGQPENFKQNRQRWMVKRLEQRAQAAHLEGDDSDPYMKIDKTQRSRLFCDWLVASLGQARLAAGMGVVDVAGGGKGDMAIQLWIQRGIPTTLIDPRPMKLSKYNRRLVVKVERMQGRTLSRQLLCCFNDETLKLHTELFAKCSVLVGMHPDEATEAIVDAALALSKPFAVVPCCVMSRMFPDRQCQDGTPVDTYDTFITYLIEKHSSIQRAFLPFAGRNQVLYLFDYSDEQNA